MENEAVKDITLQVEGMTCNNCAIGLKKHLEDNSINNVSVDFSLGEVNCSANHNTKDEIISIIEEIGYKVKNPDQKEKKYSKVEILFCISLIFTIPLFSHMFLGHDNILYDPLVQLILCLPVYFIGIIYFRFKCSPQSYICWDKIGRTNGRILHFGSYIAHIKTNIQMC